jgi:hypothetical protein
MPATAESWLSNTRALPVNVRMLFIGSGRLDDASILGEISEKDCKLAVL